MRAPALACLTAALLLALAGCGDGGRDSSSDATATTAATQPAKRTRTTAPPLCRRLTERVTGHVDDALATELSGLAFSRRDDRRLYAENDSGNAPQVLVLDTRGRVLAKPVVSGATNVDWEDVATLRTRARGSELLVGDIGDNDAQRASIVVYRVPEPGAGATATAPAAAETLRYPDGAHNAETLIADPLRDELVIVTKGLLGARAYRAPAARPSATLVRGPQLPIGLVTGGDVSADGRTVVLRDYSDLYVWRRRGREPLTRALGREPACEQPLADEGQGEAVAIARGARSVMTVPEGRRPALRRYSSVPVS